MKQEKFASLQALRGIAAVLVVLYHVVVMTHFDGSTDTKVLWLRSVLQQFGSIGVEIFFVLSGFIITYAAFHRELPTDSATFLRRRFIRIYPPYFLYAALAVAVYVVSKIYFNDQRPDWAFAIKTLLLFPTFDERGKFYSALIVGWTLVFEVYFYLLLAAALAFKLNYRKTIVFVLLIFLAGNLFAGRLAAEHAVFYLLSSVYLWFFLGGMVLYGLYYHRLNISRGFFYLALALTVSTWLMVLAGGIEGLSPKLVIWILAHASVALAITPLINRLHSSSWLQPLVKLGDASYTLYLYHWLGIVVISACWKRDFMAPPVAYSFWTIVALTVALCAGGLVLYRLIEVPLIRVENYRRIFSKLGGNLRGPALKPMAGAGSVSGHNSDAPPVGAGPEGGPSDVTLATETLPVGPRSDW